MHIEVLRNYCLQKKESEECFPFGDDTLVYKVGGKIFLITTLTNDNTFNVKCDPEKAIELREKYIEIKPGFHMNKKHWNTISMDGRLTELQLFEQIDHSYDLVFYGLPKKMRDQIQLIQNI